MVRTFGILLLAGLVLGANVPLYGQTKTDQQPLVFEAASLKLNNSGSIIVNQSFTNGRYTGTNLSLFDLVAIVNSPMPRSRIVGGPTWIKSDRFDVAAIADPRATQDQLAPMLRSLLAERFKLTTHKETRDADVYDLIVARSGELRAGLRRSTASCIPVDAPKTTQEKTPRCPGGTYPGRVFATAVTPSMIARMLMPWLEQREVRDRTGLDGRFDVELTFTPDRAPTLPPNAPDDLRNAVEAIDPNGPSIFTAVQEQLGLKLEATKAPVDVLVIDRVERPTPD